MVKPCILVVEDDDLVAAMIADTLLAEGYDVDMVRNGADALRRLSHGQPPRLMLLDWSMPVMSAPEMFETMSSQIPWRGLPVVLITGSQDAKNKALAVRASGYLKKPIALDDLLRMVNALLREQPSRTSRGGTVRELDVPAVPAEARQLLDRDHAHGKGT